MKDESLTLTGMRVDRCQLCLFLHRQNFQTSDLSNQHFSCCDSTYTFSSINTSCFFYLQAASESEIYKILFDSSNKQCDSDPIPTWLLEKCSVNIVSLLTFTYRTCRPQPRRVVSRKRMTHRVVDLPVYVRCGWRGFRVRPAGVAPSQSRASRPLLDVRPESAAACVEHCSVSISVMSYRTCPYMPATVGVAQACGVASNPCGRGLVLSIKVRWDQCFVTTHGHKPMRTNCYNLLLLLSCELASTFYVPA